MVKKLVMLLLWIVGISGWVFANDATEQAAQVAIAQWNAVLNSGKLDQLLQLYAKDAMVVLPNGKAVTDPVAIREFWRQLLTAKPGHYALDLDKVLFAQGDTLISALRWSNLDGSLKYSYDGLIYSVFKRQPDGSWKAQVQRWN